MANSWAEILMRVLRGSSFPKKTFGIFNGGKLGTTALGVSLRWLE